MPSDDPASDDRITRLEARIDRLEEVVAELRAAVLREQEESERTSAVSTSESEGAGEQSTAGFQSETSSPSVASEDESTFSGGVWQTLSSFQRRSEEWVSYVGIGLVLFGLAFLFKYSIEQGWLVPEVRVGFGALIGGALLWAGLQIYEKRRQFRQVLLGGSIATFYGTIFAAYQLYGLLAYPLAFGSMIAVTTVAIVLSLHQDHASMAVIGTIGGLGTPFLLYGDVSGVAGLTVYTCMVLAGACAIYLYRGWQAVLYSAVVGGWIVLLVPSADVALSETVMDGVWVLQGGIVVAWLLLGGTPVLRQLLQHWTMDGTVWGTLDEDASSVHLRETPVLGLIPTSPFAAFLASRLLWAGSAWLWGSIAVAGAVLYAAAYARLSRISFPRLASGHALVAAVLLTYGVTHAVEGAALLLAWAVEALLLLVLARRLRDRTLQIAGHILFAIVGTWFATRLTRPGPEADPLFSTTTLSEGVVIGLVGGAAWAMRLWPQYLYYAVTLVGWLAWGWHLLVQMPNGQAFISVAWGGTAAVLLAIGAVRNATIAQTAGLVTLGLFVGKLFLIDLATLPALWRIVLFLGAGGVFLLVSYALPGLGGLVERRGRL